MRGLRGAGRRLLRRRPAAPDAGVPRRGGWPRCADRDLARHRDGGIRAGTGRARYGRRSPGTGGFPGAVRTGPGSVGTPADPRRDGRPAGRVAHADHGAAGPDHLHHRPRRGPQDFVDRVEPVDRRRDLVEQLQGRILLAQPLGLAPHHVVHVVREPFQRLGQPVDVERELAVRALPLRGHPGGEIPGAHAQRPGIELGQRLVQVAAHLAHRGEGQPRRPRQRGEDDRRRGAGAGVPPVPGHRRPRGGEQRRDQRPHQGIDGARPTRRVVPRPVVRGHREPAEHGAGDVGRIRALGGIRPRGVRVVRSRRGAADRRDRLGSGRGGASCSRRGAADRRARLGGAWPRGVHVAGRRDPGRGPPTPSGPSAGAARDAWFIRPAAGGGDRWG